MSSSDSKKDITEKNLDEILESSLEDLNQDLDKLAQEVQTSPNEISDEILEDDNDIDEEESEMDEEEQKKLLMEQSILLNEHNNLENDDDEFVELTYEEIIPVINQKYIHILQNLYGIFENHEKLGSSIKEDVENLMDKSNSSPYAILNLLTDNFLYCLNEVKDLNTDFFAYQEEKKIKKKNGKITKTKISKVGERTTVKSILPHLKTKTKQVFFKDLFEIFELLVYEDDGEYFFHEEYVEYIKKNFSNNKNYNKIMITLDNVSNIFSDFDTEDMNEQIQQSIDQEKKMKEEKKNKKSKGKKQSSSSGGMPNIGENFMKGIEDTKIASLAKNISEKINVNEFPVLNDPSKLLSSLTNPDSQEEGQGIGDLLQFVVGEVQSAFKDGEGLKEGDLVNEAQNIMGKFGNMAGFDPAKMMNNPNLNLDKFADIFKDMAGNMQDNNGSFNNSSNSSEK